jgi:hypothetical protein
VEALAQKLQVAQVPKGVLGGLPEAIQEVEQAEEKSGLLEKVKEEG